MTENLQKNTDIRKGKSFSNRAMSKFWKIFSDYSFFILDLFDVVVAFEKKLPCSLPIEPYLEGKYMFCWHPYINYYSPSHRNTESSPPVSIQNLNTYLGFAKLVHLHTNCWFELIEKNPYYTVIFISFSNEISILKFKIIYMQLKYIRIYIWNLYFVFFNNIFVFWYL